MLYMLISHLVIRFFSRWDKQRTCPEPRHSILSCQWRYGDKKGIQGKIWRPYHSLYSQQWPGLITRNQGCFYRIARPVTLPSPARLVVELLLNVAPPS